MKSIILYLSVFFLVVSSSNNAHPVAKKYSYEIFYISLKPYGEWIEIDRGLVVWRPIKIHAGWRPYLIGRWCWTKYGWYWDSFEPFGWAVYHYGRWYYDYYYGWIWIPDDVWGPAWVEWRYDDVYIGWAPLSPYAQFNINIGIHFTIKWHSHHHYWNFVRYNHFYNHNVHHYVIESNRVPLIFNRSKYKVHYYYKDGRIINAGIDPVVVERKTRIRLKEFPVHNLDNYDKIERLRYKDGKRVYTYKLSERDYKNIEREREFELKRSDREISFERNKYIYSEREDRKNNKPEKFDYRDESFLKRKRNLDESAFDHRGKENNSAIFNNKIEKRSSDEGRNDRSLGSKNLRNQFNSSSNYNENRKTIRRNK